MRQTPKKPTPPVQPPPRFRQTKTARLARDRLRRGLKALESDRDLWLAIQRQVPEAWATLAEDVDVEEPKVKITLRLDQSVVRFYRAMGSGYQARINRILATYAQMQIGEVERRVRAASRLRERMAEVAVPPEVRDLLVANPDLVAQLDPEVRAFFGV